MGKSGSFAFKRKLCNSKFMRKILLLHILLVIAACGDMGGDASVPTTTFTDLFSGPSNPPVVVPVRVANWDPVELVSIRKEADKCVESARPEAVTLPDDGPRTVTVESGDTLGSLASRFDSSVEAFMRSNALSNPDRLRVGQVLVIPRERPEQMDLEIGPEIEWEELRCTLDTKVDAHGPDGSPVGVSGHIEVVVRWPRIDGPDESPKVNGRLLGLIQAAAAQFLSDVITSVEQNGYMCSDSWDGRCMWLLHEYEVLLSTDNVFSLRNTVRSLQPGFASEMSEVLTETFDLETGRPIKIGMLFEVDSDWITAVSEEVLQRLGQEPWVDERRFRGAGPDEINFERFNLTHGGLVMSFAPLTVGGSGANTLSITIPYRVLENVWASDGLVNQILLDQK